MSDIWLVQLLCPARHALCAMPYEPTQYSRDAIETAMATLMHEQGVNPWCGICGSGDIHAEHAKMQAETWEEATQVLLESEEEQALTRALIGNRCQPRNFMGTVLGFCPCVLDNPDFCAHRQGLQGPCVCPCHGIIAQSCMAFPGHNPQDGCESSWHNAIEKETG